MVLEAFKFMILGMGIVFLFLILMIILLNLQAKFIAHFFKPESKKADNFSTIKDINQEKTAAIVATAIQQHLKNKG